MRDHSLRGVDSARRVWWILTCLLVITESSRADTGKLVVRTLDGDSGRVIPARLVLQTSDGKFPGDRLNASSQQWPHIEAHGIFIDSEETFDLPPGPTSITAAHGLGYVSASKTVEIKAGETVSVEMLLRRAVDLRKAGWVSGDLHVHMIHGENQRQTSYEDIATTCAANGLDFVCVGQEYVGAGQLDLKGYHAECRRVSTDDFQMLLGGERPKNILGHQVVLGVEDPFRISEEVPYFQTAKAVHERGGILVYVHPIRYFPEKQYCGEWLDFPGNNLARELLFDAYLGPSFDGLSVLSDEPAHPDAHQLWFNLLNRGCFVPVFADSDACFDRPTLGLKAPGFWVTYFHLGKDKPITPKALAEATRRGRTMATTGPLVQFDIDGQISGSIMPLDGRQRTVTIHAHAPQHAFSLQSTGPKVGKAFGISRVELIRNGRVIKHWEPDAKETAITHTLAETENCWYIVRVYGSDQKWQVALTSPIYFAAQPVTPKRPALTTRVRGRIYDFLTGKERTGMVEIRRSGATLKKFSAEGQFEVRMPLDAEIVVEGEGADPLCKNLLMDYGPVHQFLWELKSSDLAKEETFNLFEHLVGNIELEFPLGYRMPGCYMAKRLTGATRFNSVRVVGGPDPAQGGTVAVAAVLTDVEQITPGETLHVGVVFRDEGGAGQCGPLVIEARGYDPKRPTGFGALKKFASIESTWEAAIDLGSGYKLVEGPLTVPDWVQAGPTGAVDLSIRVRQGHGDAAFVGLAVPLGSTKRALTISSSWPIMPLSWPDRHYGIGPLRVCNRLGRKSQPLADYRKLHLAVELGGESIDLFPARDGRGCADADDAVYTSHFLDQILFKESHLAQPDPVRSQPETTWRTDQTVIQVPP